MNLTRSVSVFVVGLLAAPWVTSCGDDGAKPEGEGATCVTDYSTLASEPPVSFRTDIMPIFGLACTASQCHNAEAEKASLFLGVKCSPDGVSKWKCTFPDAPMANGSEPLTDEIVSLVYADLMNPSATAPAAQLVVPGSPDTSFLMDKLSDKQNDKGYVCEKQDNRALGVCGDSMPQNSSWCREGASATAPLRFNAVATWIAQGAQNN